MVIEPKQNVLFRLAALESV